MLTIICGGDANPIISIKLFIHMHPYQIVCRATVSIRAGSQKINISCEPLKYTKHCAAVLEWTFFFKSQVGHVHRAHL
jgi:hypothetical protein